jgi:3-methyladenine DNA glycosylase AlkD
MASIDEALAKLRQNARPDQLGGMARFGITVEKRLGVSIPALRKIAKELGPDHQLAGKLWKTGWADARILASMIADPAELSEKQMEQWVRGFDSWDVCDQVCQNLFEKSPLAWKKIGEWAVREQEYSRRAAFALIACLAWHDRKAGDERLLALLPIIKAASTDERNYVRKAVNWALRNIGKRNRALNQAAIHAAKEIRRIDSKAARWIAADALRELESEAVQRRLKRSR